jgi:hypothetical protein
MSLKDLNRRDFTRLSLAAFGGAMAGAMTGCDSGPPTPAPTATGTGATGTGTSDAGTTGTTPAGDGDLPEGAENFLVGADHVCRGLNSCKNKDTDGDNACAGQGDCATISGTCGGSNECKGRGGCHGKAGVNSCKGEGGCHVPLMEDAWAEVRKVFEARMKADGKGFGEAPPPAES